MSFIVRYPRLVAGLVIIASIVLSAAGAPFVFPFSPWEMRGAPFLPPGSPDFLLGTDALGRDVAAGIAHGALVSLLIGGVSTVVALGIGIGLGGTAGYVGNRIDDAIMRFTEFFQTIRVSCSRFSWSRSSIRAFCRSSSRLPWYRGRRLRAWFAPSS